MLIAAIIFFLIAASFGAIVLSAVLKKRPTPKPIAIIHGSFAIIGFLILAAYVAMGNYSPLLITSLVLFGMAALGGLTLFMMDLSNKPLPKALALGHPLLAASAIIALIIFAFQLLSH